MIDDDDDDDDDEHDAHSPCSGYEMNTVSLISTRTGRRFDDSEVRRTTQLLGEVYAMKPTKKSVGSL